jgi:hypothetical protein
MGMDDGDDTDVGVSASRRSRGVRGGSARCVGKRGASPECVRNDDAQGWAPPRGGRCVVLSMSACWQWARGADAAEFP